jgi:hypothetical protein
MSLIGSSCHFITIRRIYSVFTPLSITQSRSIRLSTHVSLLTSQSFIYLWFWRPSTHSRIQFISIPIKATNYLTPWRRIILGTLIDGSTDIEMTHFLQNPPVHYHIHKSTPLYLFWTSWIKTISSHHRVQTGCGAYPASYPMGTGGSTLADKAAGAWSWPLTSI